VDPNPALLDNGEIVEDSEMLAALGEPRRGAVADGVTKLLLRNQVPSPGNVEFCLGNGSSAPADGGLHLVGAEGRAECVLAPVVETTRGAFAFAIYQVPENFDRGGDAALAERPITFTTRYTPDVGQPSDSSLPLVLRRPPVVLVHGLWSSAATWTFPLVSDSRFDVTLADYQQTNASHFATNSGVGLQFVSEALVGERLDGIAATQVDYAGHSMGGILGRIHATLPGYGASANFNEGDINKLITLNTPHTGSPLGNLVNGIRAIPFLGGWFEDGMRNIGHPVDEGALEDLANGSTAIQNLQQVEVPSHAIVGVGGSDALAFVPGWIGRVYTVVNFFSSSSDLFQGLQHDGVVGRNSQEGGLPIGAYSVFGGLDSIHTSVPGSQDHSERLIELLGADPSISTFADLPAAAVATSSMMPVAIEMAAFPAIGYDIAAVDLVISAPADGTSVSPGESVTIVVDDPNTPSAVSSVLLVGDGIAVADDAAPFEIDITVPIDLVGELTLSAIGSDGGGGFIGSNSIRLNVVSDAVLLDLKVLPQDPILLSLGEQRSFVVIGTYDDGEQRDITDPSTGTVYASADPTVATVDADGVVTSIGAGVTTVIARNGERQDSISVTVFQPNAAPSADAGSGRTVRLGSLVMLDGTASIDPDGIDVQLTYSWLQTAGPATTLSAANSSTPQFQPNAPGSYIFSLVVSDGQSDSTPSAVNITVPPLGDIDLDDDVDRDDLTALLAVRNESAQGANDLLDLNGDGVVSARDARLLVLGCTRLRCATE